MTLKKDYVENDKAKANLYETGGAFSSEGTQHSESDLELTHKVLEELLDAEGWREVLDTYARTMKLAVALTDCEGRQLGQCYNAQPTWLLADAALKRNGVDRSGACAFCIDPSVPCRTVKTALSTERIESCFDSAGMAHLAVPLVLGGHRLGAIIAGQVFDHYPDPLRLQRLARKLEVSAQDLWQTALQESPIRAPTLHVYGELLGSLSRAVLRQRYATILNAELARANLRLGLSLDRVKGHALYTIDGLGLVTSWNRGAERMFGYAESEILGKSFSVLFPNDEIQAGVPGKLIRQANDDGWVDDNGWQVRKGGERFFAEGSLAGFGKGESREFGRLTHDITERRTAEEALRQSQKLESIGLLASGIAHDFNNLLAGILGGVSFAKTSLPLSHPAYPLLVLAEQSSEKAAELIQQLLAYGGQGKFIASKVDLSALIREILELLKTSIPKSVELHLALQSDLPWIEADASQIQQIVMNLVINGAESMGPEGGTLRVSTGTTFLEKPSDGHAGVHVCMEVQDSGSGMTEETKARIFDPFFTTKLTGRGLGLAAVSGILRSHEGTMEVESALGKGSTFRIYFPGVERRGLPPEVAPAAITVAKGLGTILVVDDERPLREVAQAILEDGGYTVLLAANGREAVDVFQKHSDTIAVILLDMTMPIMNGAEAFRLLRRIRADVPIVISTGYSEGAMRDCLEGSAPIEFIQKPYTALRLREVIGAALSAGLRVNVAEAN